MLNFRKLRQDFSSNILKQGKDLYDTKMVVGAKILHIDADTVRVSGSIAGNFNNNYESEIEIDRDDSSAIDSNCDCPYSYDCQHIAALLFHLEEHLDHIIISFSKETDLDQTEEIDEEDKQEIIEVVKEAKNKQITKKNKTYQKELLTEYTSASELLSNSPYFFTRSIQTEVQNAELAIIFHAPDNPVNVVLQMALRLPFRSKPLNIPNVRAFLNAMRFNEPILIGGKRYCFSAKSFPEEHFQLIKIMIDHVSSQGIESDVNPKLIPFAKVIFGDLVYKAYLFAKNQLSMHRKEDEEVDDLIIPAIYCTNIETPLKFSLKKAAICFDLESMQVPAPKLFLQPYVVLNDDSYKLEEVLVFEGAKPGVVYQNTYHAFPPLIRRTHLLDLKRMHDVVIPEPLFGTFIENSLPELMRFAAVRNQNLLEEHITLPYANDLKARCVLSYIDGELDAALYFIYDGVEVPVSSKDLDSKHLCSFVTEEGILARNLVDEKILIEKIFSGFIFQPKTGVFVAKSEKAIVEFMTSIVPECQDIVTFECPQNLLNQFIYDETSFELKFTEAESIDQFAIELKVNGHLNNIKLDLLWECCSSKRNFIELESEYPGKKKGKGIHKILVLDLERITPIIQFFDELGLTEVTDHRLLRPLWVLATIHATQLAKLPIKISMSKKVKEIQKQILGNTSFKASAIPQEVNADLRSYQQEGVQWLERLRTMHLNGILADDMGLGKTLQAIVALTQYYNQETEKTLSLIICPTSLLYNWYEEFHRFNPKLKVMVVDGIPNQRKKLLKNISKYQILITSYSLLQKDVEHYQKHKLGYVILDEAQHIKNRCTRNAQSVKMLQAGCKLILTGTPIENSLLELWSLFDFLMPGLLSSYKRFVEKYMRDSGHSNKGNLEQLKKKVSPFILRRMKADVLKDLPPVSQIIYHCQLTPTQQELYTSYVNTAREELSSLVKKEGFEKIQIHVLATLTRLKQICCHPAIFAKDDVESGDSAKYEMLFELLDTLIEGKHKIVIFSQYTRMLKIMREDLEQRGISFAYLDGSVKDRMQIVKNFNEDPSISVFLVSLKAGGAGLNLVGADTVIHYDMWWNPAVENQATDRVHRLGQNKSVMSYKLVTLGTIEEKIISMQDKKRGLVKQVICSDDEAMSKLTWEEVLELLQV